MSTKRLTRISKQEPVFSQAKRASAKRSTHFSEAKTKAFEAKSMSAQRFTSFSEVGGNRVEPGGKPGWAMYIVSKVNSCIDSVGPCRLQSIPVLGEAREAFLDMDRVNSRDSKLF